MQGRKFNLPGNIKTVNSSKIYIGLSANQLKKTYSNTLYNNKQQTKRQKLPPVQTSNRTFKRLQKVLHNFIL